MRTLNSSGCFSKVRLVVKIKYAVLNRRSHAGLAGSTVFSMTFTCAAAGEHDRKSAQCRVRLNNRFTIYEGNSDKRIPHFQAVFVLSQ